MKNFFKSLIYFTVLAVMLGGFSAKANAETLPTVQFEQTPLFSNVNFVPGDSVSRYIQLNNNTSLPHRAILRAINVDNEGNLKNAVEIVIKKGDTVLYDDTFANLFSLSELVLPQVPANSSARFDFVVTFKNEAGDEYQNDTMGFNLQIGFEDIDEVANDTVSIGGSIGGGGGNGPIIVGQKNLIINNESINSATPPQSTAVTIIWDTNMPATSQVIYGLTSNGPYNLDLTKANFGYPFMTTEDPSKVLNHSVSIYDLAPEQVYSYRVVSRASPPTVSYEHKFVLNSDGTVRFFDDSVVNPVISQNNTNNAGNNTNGALAVETNQQETGNINAIAQNSTEASSTTVNEVSPKNIDQTASVFNAFSLSKKTIISAIILLIFIILIFLIYKKRRNDNQ